LNVHNIGDVNSCLLLRAVTGYYSCFMKWCEIYTPAFMAPVLCTFNTCPFSSRKTGNIFKEWWCPKTGITSAI